MLLKGRPAAARIEKFGIALQGSLDGANTIFTTPDVFDPDTLRVYYNGVRIYAGATNDFTVTGASQVTTLFAPKAGDRLAADYVIG